MTDIRQFQRNIEDKIKALSEFKMTQCLHDTSPRGFQSIMNKLPGFFLVTRGGDAFSYYFNEIDTIPTHDYDLGLTRLGDVPPLSQQQFDFIRTVVIELLNYFVEQFNIFFQTELTTSPFTVLIRTLNFRIGKLGDRLGNVIYDFNYYFQGIQHNATNALIDLYIMDEVQQGVINNGILVYNDFHWKPKLNELNSDLRLGLGDELQKQMQLLNSIGDNYYTTNKYELLFQDNNSLMYYMAPGDLLNDTMRMVLWSLNEFRNQVNNGINPNILNQNLKILKYVYKYSKLLNIVNKVIDICNGNCILLNPEIMQRDLNNYTCDGQQVRNRNGYIIANLINGPYPLTNYLPFYYLYQVMNMISLKKLCNIWNILRHNPHILL